jgi:hypothetical protein
VPSACPQAAICVVQRRLDRLAQVENLAVDGVGDEPIPLAGRVLVDEGGSAARLAHPGHELPGAGPDRRGHGVTRVVEVVKVHWLHSGVGECLYPALAEAVPSQGASLGPDEGQAVNPRFGELVQVPAQVGEENLREPNPADPRPRSWVSS